MNTTLWINSHQSDATDTFCRYLRYLLDDVNPCRHPLAFACIGSVHADGDNFGPLIGSILSRYQLPHIYGTMHSPVNGLTLMQYHPLFHAMHGKYCLIAVDAAIGHPGQSGYITLSKGPLFPGSAQHRQFPPVGDIAITGVFSELYGTKARMLAAHFCRQITPALLQLV